MKQSWIIGTIMLWILIFSAEMMATGATGFSDGAKAQMNAMMNTSMINSAGAVSALVTIAVNVGTYFMTFINAIFLWSPTVFAGNWIWFWQFVCLPIGVSWVVVIITIVRGVHAS